MSRRSGSLSCGQVSSARSLDARASLEGSGRDVRDSRRLHAVELWERRQGIEWGVVSALLAFFAFGAFAFLGWIARVAVSGACERRSFHEQWLLAHFPTPPFSRQPLDKMAIPLHNEMCCVGSLAQLAEQLTLNQLAQGSSP